MMKTLIVPAIALVMTVMAFAGQRVTGTWSLVPSRSDFAGQASIQTGTVTIDSRQGNIYISRNFKFDSPEQTFWYNFSTDGREGATIKSKDGNRKSKAKWDDGGLKVTTTEANGTTVEHYKVQEDGSMILNLSRPGRSPIVMVFEKQAQ
jgi:hypothetical protein